MRKSIFDIVSESIDMESETNRILTMAEKENMLCCDSFTDYKLFEFVEEFCFSDWEYRGHFISVNDYLTALDFKELKRRAAYDTDAHLTIIELVYNFWNLAYQKLIDKDTGYEFQWCGNYFHLKDVMDDILDQYNHIAYQNNGKACILVIENKEEVTAAAEILPESLSLDVIKYNHRTLQGNVELKKSILFSLGAELEPKRKELQVINKQLSDDIFFMLNSINIRHNNRSKKDQSKYKEYVAKMTKKQLEKWYDELYQMILLAFLLLDNVERIKKVKKLKENIIGK